MGDCNDTLRELEAFLDDEITDQTRVTIHAHLEGCPDCHSAFDFHAELKQVISAKCRDEQLPPSLLTKIQACFGVEPDAGGSAAPTA